MRKIKLAGTGEIVPFPDSWSDEQIKEVLSEKFKLPTQNTKAPLEGYTNRPENLKERVSRGVADFLQKGIISNSHAAHRIGDLASEGSEFTPAGFAYAAEDVARATDAGDYGSAALSAVTSTPLVDKALGAVGAVAKAGGKKLKEIFPDPKTGKDMYLDDKTGKAKAFKEVKDVPNELRHELVNEGDEFLVKVPNKGWRRMTKKNKYTAQDVLESRAPKKIENFTELQTGDMKWTLTDKGASGLTGTQYDYHNLPQNLKDRNYLQENKGIEVDVVEMSPDEYIDEAVKIFKLQGHNTNKKKLMDSRKKVDHILEKVKNGEKLGVPYLDYNNAGQEGLHRAVAAKNLGIETIPVQRIKPIRKVNEKMGSGLEKYTPDSDGLYATNANKKLADEQKGDRIPEDLEPFKFSNGYIPENTRQGYKILKRGKDGKLYPPMVEQGRELPIGEWLEANMGEIDVKVVGKGNKTPQLRVSGKQADGFAPRGGLHTAREPWAEHIGGKAFKGDSQPNYRRPWEVWVEVDLPDDLPYQTEVLRRAEYDAKGNIKAATADMVEVPYGGSYYYNTKSDNDGVWNISGGMKINREIEQHQKDLPSLPQLLLKNPEKKLDSFNKEMVSELKEYYPDVYEAYQKGEGIEEALKKYKKKDILEQLREDFNF